VTDRLPEAPSAGVLLNAVVAERQVRLDAIDAMTNRAGIVLGFTGALVALTPLLDHLLSRFLVFIPAAVTVRYSLKALKTTLLPGIKPMKLRQKLLMQPALGAQLRLLDVLGTRHEQLVSALRNKVDQVNTAGAWLVITIVVFAGAGLIEGLL
jgi:hypothetical protein